MKEYYVIFGAQMVNKGAQAMLFTTISEIRKRDNYAKIIVFIYDKWKSEESQDIYNVEFLPIDMKQIMNLSQGILSKVYLIGKRAKINRKSGKLSEIDYILRHSKMAFDISGYALSDQWGLNGSLFFLSKFSMLQKYKIPTYIMPQSFGPFNYSSFWKKTLIRNYAKRYLKYPKIIYAREKEGYDCLTKELGLDNVCLSTDLVLQNDNMSIDSIYRVKPLFRRYDIKKNSVAIIPNSSNNKYSGEKQLLLLYEKIIIKLLQYKKNIYLLVHSSQDFEMCQEIKAMFQSENTVEIIKSDLNCIEYGYFIRQFDFAIASRYHSIVNAYKEYIPCIALGWATKYKELLSLLKQDQFNFDVRNVTDFSPILSAINEMNDTYKNQSMIIQTNLKSIQESSCFLFLNSEIGFPESKVKKNVQMVVESNMCSGCGICESVCPVNCISYSQKDGNYVPQLNADKCLECGLCLKICPGCGFDYVSAWKNNVPKNKMGGNALSCYSAFTKDKTQLKCSTSGGCVSSIVKWLLQGKRYDAAFLVNANSFDKQVKVDKVERACKVIDSSKSKYVPVAQTPAVKFAIDNPSKKIIFIGTPCHIHGIINVINHFKLKRENYLLLGLFCDRTMSYDIWDFFNDQYADGNLSKLYFRDKDNGGWPGNLTCIINGKITKMPSYIRTSVKDYFQLETCLYCYDKLNQFADISFGDDYAKREMSYKVDGMNSVIVRTNLGQSIWNECKMLFSFESEDLGEIIESQHLNDKTSNVTYNKLHCSIIEKNTGFREISPKYDAVKNYEKRLHKIRIGKNRNFNSIKEKSSREYRQQNSLLFKFKRKVRHMLGV